MKTRSCWRPCPNTSRPDARIHVMAHFNHPRELTEHAYRAINALQRAGVILVNQTPVLRGI